MITTRLSRTFASAGKVFTWGETTFGWGRPVKEELRIPGEVQEIDNVIEVATGPYHMLLQTNNREVFSVGLGTNGRLGHGSNDTLESPESIEELRGEEITQIAAGWNHSMALSKSGDVFSWGYGGVNNFLLENLVAYPDSPLGHGKSGDLNKPRLVEGLASRVMQIAAGSYTSLALMESGEIYGWGHVSFLVDEDSSTPVKLEQLNYFLHKNHSNVVKMVSTGFNAFFLLDNGRLYTIGKNKDGVFGTRNNPKVITDDFLSSLTKIVDEDYSNERIVDFKVSANSLIFITDLGSVFYNGMRLRYRPERFPTNQPIKSIFATYDSVGVIYEDGQINFINDAILDEHLKKGNLMVSMEESLKKAFEIGGTYQLRYALVEK